jgi:hypothetical protein
MLSSTKETLRRPRTSSRGRVLLTCPLSERYYRTFTTYDVEVPENIIVFLRPDTATGLASPVQHDSRARLPSPTLSSLGNAVRITCPPVSVNGRPRAHLNPSEPLHLMQSKVPPSRLLRCLQTTQHTRAAVIVDHRTTVHHSLLFLNSNHLALLLFPLSSFPHAHQHCIRVTAPTLPSPPLIVRHKLGC